MSEGRRGEGGVSGGRSGVAINPNTRRNRATEANGARRHGSDATPTPAPSEAPLVRRDGAGRARGRTDDGGAVVRHDGHGARIARRELPARGTGARRSARAVAFKTSARRARVRHAGGPARAAVFHSQRAPPADVSQRRGKRRCGHCFRAPRSPRRTRPRAGIDAASIARPRARASARRRGRAKAASGRRRVERRRRVRRGEGGREARERDGALRLPRHGEVVGAAEPARGHPATDRDARPGRRRGHHGHHLVRHADARVRVHVARGEALRGTDRAPSRGFPSQKTNRAPPHLPRFPSTNLRPAAPRVRRRRTCSR